MRLIGFASVALGPGESRSVTIEIDPKLLSHLGSGRFPGQKACMSSA